MDTVCWDLLKLEMISSIGSTSSIILIGIFFRLGTATFFIDATSDFLPLPAALNILM
jgi:hypothetical protein